MQLGSKKVFFTLKPFLWRPFLARWSIESRIDGRVARYRSVSWLGLEICVGWEGAPKI